MKGDEGLGGFVMGICVIIISIFALPGLLKVVMPASAATGADGGGGLLSAAGKFLLAAAAVGATGGAAGGAAAAPQDQRQLMPGLVVPQREAPQDQQLALFSLGLR